jgi:pimeloyl-ACP methyl ester carboxylesterase
MRRILRWLGWTLIAFAVFVALGVRRDRPAAAVEQRWATPPSRFVSVDGMRVHYRDRGQGPAVLLLHGSTSSLFTWEGWAAALAPDHRVITVDLPGHGLTGPDPERRYGFSDMAAFVDHFATAIGLERFSLGGNSMGGGIAWHYALAHGDKLDKLILVDPFGYPQKPVLVFKLFRMPVIGHIVRWVTPRFAIAKSVRDVYGDPSRVTEALIDRYEDMTLRAGNREATRQRQSGFVDDGLTAKLGQIHTPTLILWGSRDKWIAPANGERFAHDIPGAKLVQLEGLGHVPMEEDPERSVAPVLAFLK